MRYFLRLSYNGARFHGWQTQPNATSVQQTIEEALAVVCRSTVAITGAGRTDTGVHARCMYAHFDMPQPVEDKHRFLLSLNRLAGKDITFHDLIEVPGSAHARFDATERTYKYFVTYAKSSFLYPFSWHSPSRLNVDKMNEAARLLVATDDFSSFAKLHSDAKTNICDVREASWAPLHGNGCGEDTLSLPVEGIVFTITADRFLRNMVRAVVGTLVDVGKGKLDIDGFKRIIEMKDRCSAGVSMPAEALFLWNVKYPYIPD